MKQNKTNRNLIRFGALMALVAMWVVLPFVIGDRSASAEEMAGDIRIGASLSGSPIGGVTPAGFSEWRLEDDGRKRLEVSASSLNLPAGTVLVISVNNAIVGQMGVSSFGTGFFRIRTQDGQSVPNVSVGMPIVVTNGSETVLAGTFGTVTPTPSPSGSPFPSPTASPTGSPNPSPSPTGSPNPSPSPTGSPNPSPSPTGSPNPSPSPTGSPNPSPSPTGSPNPSPSPNAGGLFASLNGPTINGILPTGFAQFEVHSSRLELEVRVSRVNLPAGTQLQVLVDSTNVGSLFLESGGEGRLRLRTDEGQPIPPIVSGSKIALRNNSANILVGIFEGASPSPTPSASPTASPSPGETPSPSPSPSPNETPSPSPTPSLGRAFESRLTGAGVLPAVQTNATAEIKVTLNATETQATIFGEFHNLGSDQTGARIEAMVGDGSVVHSLGVVGGSSGNFASVTIDVSAAQVSQLRSGLWSAVITSSGNPAGEIRGRLTQRSNLSDFDGDGSNDLAVFRPSAGAWYTLNSSGFSASSFGTASDKVVSADYDGDGRTDLAVFQNVNGLGIWQIKRSSDGGVTAEGFGYASDLPARGDFDGDGINDIAVYRPSNGVWYVKKSNGTGYISVRFGAEEDRPIPLDVDGDGRDDIAVFRPSTGMWYWLRSSDGQFSGVPFGQSGDVPVRGDFDGDGKSDITVFRPSTGIWYSYLTSTGGYRSVRFGMAGDIPVAGNYDGDSKADIAVFRPSDGTWYILRTVDGGFQAGQFGLSGDLPVNAR